MRAMLTKNHWAVRATRRAAIAVYVIGTLACIVYIVSASIIGGLSPHHDFLGTLDAMTSFRHERLWLVSSWFVVAIVAVDIFFRCRGLYARD
jgi:hypothetical protein